MTGRNDARSTVTLAVRGMTCGSCVRHVQTALAALPGVEDAAVDLASRSATVTFGPSAVRAEELVGAVEEAGYEAEVDRVPGARLPIAPSGSGCSCCAS